jgi:hypothetical protein
MGAMFALPGPGTRPSYWRYGSDSYFLSKRLTFDPLID